MILGCLSVLPREGAPRLGRDSQLRVGRDTELYRILNMHYNKSNVYQVSASVCSFLIYFFPFDFANCFYVFIKSCLHYYVLSACGENRKP